jgi:transposase
MGEPGSFLIWARSDRAHARNVRQIGNSRRKDDRLDAQALARLARIDPRLLLPIDHRSAQAQADLSVIRARYALVRAKTALVQVALAPMLSAPETITGRIREYDAQIEKLAEESYPEVALLKQVKGVGTLIALTYVLTLEDPRRFRKSRDAGCYVGLQPVRRNSGQSEPQGHITKEGDSYFRMVLVQGVQHILGPFGGLRPAAVGN